MSEARQSQQRAAPLLQSLLLLAATVVGGLILRFAPIGFPRSVIEDCGSTTWALSIYWLTTALFRSWTIPVRIIVAGVTATAIEFFKLRHTPTLAAFRLTLPGILLLGRFFSPSDILAYWIAILIGAVGEAYLVLTRSPRPRLPLPTHPHTV